MRAAALDVLRALRLGDPGLFAESLSAADPATAVPALAKALADSNADVRKAAVLSLTRHLPVPEARAALATATTDSDADVRAYAARAS